jgi:hypothetical protein
MAEMTPVHISSRPERMWEVASDLLITTALLWALPLLLGVARLVGNALTRWVFVRL